MNKVALITGGTRGIGKEIAYTLAEENYDIIINYRTENEELMKLKKEIEQKRVRCLLLKGDVSNFEDCKKLVEEAINRMNHIDVLVNNAGITKDMLLMRMKQEDFKQVLDTNLVGTFNVTKNVISYMMKARSGNIVNISSVSGVMGNAGQVNYSASKAGVIGMTKAVAREMASRGITCNAVAPGFIKTDMTDVLSDTIRENINAQIPMRTFGETADVANLVAFLASDEAKYITGQVICVDGGMAI